MLRELREHYGSRWPRDARRHRTLPAKRWRKHGFTISAGEWHDDVHAVGVALN